MPKAKTTAEELYPLFQRVKLYTPARGFLEGTLKGTLKATLKGALRGTLRGTLRGALEGYP